MDVQQFGVSRFRSLVAQLELEQGPRLLEELRTAGQWQDWVPDTPATCVLRAPRPYIEKVLSGTFSEILLPHLPNRKSSGSSGLTVNWELCGFQSHDVPSLPNHVRAFPDVDSNLVLDTSVLDEAIDFLQSYAAAMDINVEDQDFDNVEYLALQRCVAIFQLLMQGMDPSAVHAISKRNDWQGKRFLEFI